MLFQFLLVQLLLFRKVMMLHEPETQVYINTLLPLGAAIAGKLQHAPVTYHIHETAISLPFFRSYLVRAARQLATKVVFASRFLQSQFSFPKATTYVVQSCLPESFIQEAILHAHQGSRKTVLMVAPLESGSGIPELLKLAALMPHTKFELVIDTNEKELNSYFGQYVIPENLLVYGTQINLHPFYQRAAVVLNLSDMEHYQDTFDISILEAMSYGRPVIVPLAGGVNELVAHGWNGYRVSGHYIDKVRTHVEQLLQNKPLYADMSCAAQLVASQFKPEFFRQQVEDIFLAGTYFSASRKKEQLAEVLLYPAALQEYINNAVN
jgi:glycosyltransferase involved in cell wall biosynthesis